MSIITEIYCSMALSLAMIQKYTKIDPNAAYSVAFQTGHEMSKAPGSSWCPKGDGHCSSGRHKDRHDMLLMLHEQT